jgi:hypothetical protein
MFSSSSLSESGRERFFVWLDSFCNPFGRFVWLVVRVWGSKCDATAAVSSSALSSELNKQNQRFFEVDE